MNEGDKEPEGGKDDSFPLIPPYHMELSTVPTITESIKPPMEEQTFPILQP